MSGVQSEQVWIGPGGGQNQGWGVPKLTSLNMSEGAPCDLWLTNGILSHGAWGDVDWQNNWLTDRMTENITFPQVDIN